MSLAEQYLPTYEKCVELQGKLDFFYTCEVRQYDVKFEQLEWDPSAPPISAGSFGDVYKGRWRRENGETLDVAMKIRRETVNEKNVSEMLIEEENLR